MRAAPRWPWRPLAPRATPDVCSWRPRHREFARLDGIVTLVDAKHIEAHLDEEKPEGVENEAVEQVCFADRLLLNKVDLVSEADLERIEGRLREANKYAPVLRCQNAEVGMEHVLGIQAFELQRAPEARRKIVAPLSHSRRP